MTLVEVMIASSVLLVCLTSLAGLLGGSVTSSRLARIRDEAANLANEKIEYARSLAYDRVGVRYANGAYGSPAGDIRTPETVGSFTVITECSWVRTGTGRAAYKRLVVHVSWRQPIPGEIDVTTMIYGKSEIALNGDLSVMLRYRETGNPVSNATVNIAAFDGSSRSLLSGSDGEAFFGQVVRGAATVSIIPPAGCVVDTSTLSNITIAADRVTSIVAYVQQPAQATVHVIDSSGSPLSGATVTLHRADGTGLPAVVTDGNGDALVTALLYNDYTATVTKTGYSSATAPFTVGAGMPQQVVPVTVNAWVGVGLTVHVTDVNDTPIANASVAVKLNGATLVSGASGTNGQAPFTGLSAGTYVVAVTAAGYQSAELTCYLHDGDVDWLDFHMTPVVEQGSMRITTRNGHGNVVGGIRVVVDGPDPYYTDRRYTDDHGVLLLENLAPGSYQVRCYYNSAGTASVLVNAGQTSEVAVSQTTH